MEEASRSASPATRGRPACATESCVVDLTDPGARLAPGPAAWLAGHLRSAAAYLGASGEVRIRIVADDEMAEAHVRYSGVPGTTDVLTFDLREHAEGPLDTDLLICIDEAVRQCRQRGHPVERELLLYALHGVLHCLGEDDLSEEASRRMHAREDGVLEAIGVGATFSTGPAGDGAGPGAHGRAAQSGEGAE